MLTRDEILSKAAHDCMCEMYAKAQPAADWDNIVEEYRSGKIGKNERVYDRHYLSMDEFLYIRDKYKTAYNIKKTWKPDMEFLEELLTEGGLKDGYVNDWIDSEGNKHRGYRNADDVLPLKEQINNLLNKYDGTKAAVEDAKDELAKDITNLVMETIKNYKNFYRFDREADDFDVNISLGASPCNNADTVKKWWKENYNQDIEIEERNPKLFWYRDNDYTDEDLAEEFDSENWKEIVNKEWEEEKAEKKRKQEEALKALEKEYEKFKNSSHKDPIGEQGDDAKEVLSKYSIENEIKKQ